MSELAYRLLTSAEIDEAYDTLPGWKFENNVMSKEFSFETYGDGVEFSRKVADTADRMDHHPDIHLTYKKVRISMWTHTVGGLSPFDLELARRIEALV
jgi:4a-hydroxytetrahydrobiopterin dehydratase